MPRPGFRWGGSWQPGRVRGEPGLSREDALRYAHWLTRGAHLLGLKNVPDLVPQLEPTFGWAVVLRRAGVVLGAALCAARQVEYTDSGVTLGQVCREAQANGFFALLRRRTLDGRS
ncbi:endo alpha-1,4 polygalactosaminidase [Deinococcus hopiensis]|uniref:endo alpha-1,4 polygalactosaminidase n=1 Tax=Deinococcus hopiensis TaxID=309885 RepID=UPI001FEB713B|nr:endo alpha-1,4 polygalactosaminidase [Deinococcus hopiensis]